ncbi:hypothetical protein [Bosea sp. ANAM02]|uniref:hypothetical protein n=1 Tax=Bosea sp. ANAM02 TaxID=2020412 RepID=UPI00140F4BAF|nr:hypothetical protein [Bosea sp. ANAM02]BCB17899.1 hypothetical protein OCUBac02_07930 [Bosea sp. ANAM02]
MERRSLLKSALASAALSAPAMLPGCMLSPAAAAIRKAAPYIPGDDAELVTLGRQFDEAHAAWIPRWQEWQRIETEWRVTLDKKGMSFAEHGVDAVCSIFTEMGGDAASDANDTALAAVEAIADQIRTMPATTLAGFAAKAKVVSFDAVPMSQFIRPDDRRDYGYRGILALADALDAAARARS